MPSLEKTPFREKCGSLASSLNFVSVMLSSVRQSCRDECVASSSSRWRTFPEPGFAAFHAIHHDQYI